jgi:predicted ATP-binding protein involved in virulence
MSQFIKHLKAIGIHGRFDIDLSFQDGINIIHGSNGTGKTTLLHILANAVNQDFRRFGYLKFEKLIITLDDDIAIEISQDLLSDSPPETVTKVLINDIELESYTYSELIQQEKEEEVNSINERYYLQSSKKKSAIDLRLAYFPAFRTMIEAWATLDETDIRYMSRRIPNFRRVLKSSARSTELARILFGKFVPRLEYPSPIEIEEHIKSELIEAQLKIASLDRSLLSDSFVKTFKAIFQSSEIAINHEDSQEIISEIEKISERLQLSPFPTNHDSSLDVYKQLKEEFTSFQTDNESDPIIAKKVLSVYRNSLQQRLDEQTNAYSSIETYLKSVNQFLERKKLKISKSGRRRPELGVQIGDEESISRLQILSSGERQVLGLIYAASHMTSGRVVLIDEPEISLHIDWQRKLLPEMLKQLGKKQLIICTHSPVMASQYRDRMIELELEPTAHLNISSNTPESQYDIFFDDLEEIPF